MSSTPHTFRNGTFHIVRSSKIDYGKNFGKVFYELRQPGDTETVWLAIGRPGKTTQTTARKADR